MGIFKAGSMFAEMKRYELLEHTADTGITAFGRDLPEAFANAAYAMFDVLTDISTIREMDRFDLQVSASNLEELLVTWLDELLYLYETERLICRRFVIDDISSRDMGDSPHNGKKLCATVFGEKVDPARHEIKTEIKSVTYHQLRVEKTDNVWRVQVIFDV